VETLYNLLNNNNNNNKIQTLIVKYKISEVCVESEKILGSSFRLFTITLDTYLRNNVYKTHGIRTSFHTSFSVNASTSRVHHSSLFPYFNKSYKLYKQV